MGRGTALAGRTSLAGVPAYVFECLGGRTGEVKLYNLDRRATGSKAFLDFAEARYLLIQYEMAR